MSMFRNALALSVVLAHAAACVEPDEPLGSVERAVATTAAPAKSCYAVQVLHHTHPDNGESSPMCIYKEWTADDGWQNKSAPYPVAVYNPTNQTGGITQWFVWSEQDVCTETREVPLGGHLGQAQTEQRLLASIAADRQCAAFIPYASTGAMIRTEGRYDKSALWSGVLGEPNRDFRCWKVPDPPVAQPGEPEPELTAQQQACATSRANDIDPPPPPMPPPPPDILTATDTTDVGVVEEPVDPPPVTTPPITVDLSFDDTRIAIDDSGQYTVEYIREILDPGALADGVPGAMGPAGLEHVGVFGGGFVIVRTRDALTGEVLLESSGIAVNGMQAVVDTWGPIAEGEAAQINPMSPPPITLDDSWQWAYRGPEGDPNDPFFGMPPAHPGGSDPARPGPAGPVHAGGTHAMSTPSPTAPPARPTSYTGHTSVPGGQPIPHAQYRPPTANPWTRPRPAEAARAEIVAHLKAEHSRTAAQVRGATDVVTRERTALTNANNQVATARTAADAAQAAHTADPMNAGKATAARDTALELANAIGKARARKAAHDAAEAVRIDAMRHDELARITHELEVKMQQLEAAEAGGVPNENLRNQVRDLVAQRDLAEAIVTGQPAPGILERTGALVARLAGESPLNTALPQASQNRVTNHRAHKAHHLTAMGVASIGVIAGLVIGGVPGAVAALAVVAYHAWKAVDNHLRAEAINRGAAPTAIPDPTGGLPPAPTPPGGGGLP